MIDTIAGEIEFLVTAEDVDNALEYNWFVDGSAVSGTNNQYKHDFSEKRLFEVTCEITDGQVSIDTSWAVNVLVATDNEALPKEVKKIVIFPNPTAHFVDIDFQLRTSSLLAVEIWNTAGKMIAQVFNGRLGAGYQKVRWSGQDARWKGGSCRNILCKVQNGQ